MELITCTEAVDDEIKEIYNKIVTSESELDRSNLFALLDNFKDVRDSIDDVINNLMDEKDESKLKKIITRGLRLVII